MARHGRLGSRLFGEAWRAVATSAIVLATAVMLVRPAPTSGRSARGRFSHFPSAEAVHEGYEVKDLSARGLAYILLVLGGSAAALIGIVFLMIWLFSSWDAQNYAGMTAEQTATTTPPPPHIERHPLDDLHRVQEREQQALEGYAWLDAAHTQAHIPLDRAMTLVTGHSLDNAP